MGDVPVVQHRYLGMIGAPNEIFNETILYEREPVTQLFDMLKAVTEKQWRRMEIPNPTPPKRRLAHVYGPPGSGKSCATWYWINTRARAAGCVMAYVHCETKECYFTDEQGETSIVAFDDIEASLFPGDYRRAICIFDQALKDNMKDVVGAILRLTNKGAAVALVSSEGLRLNAGNFKNIYVIDHRFPGWSIDEFKFACQHRPFFDAIKVGAFGANADAAYQDREQLLDEKFFVAGHSARYMFTELIADVATKIAGDIAVLQPTLKVISNALIAPKCFGAVNALMSCLDACNGSTPARSSPLLHVGEWPAVDPIPDDQGKRTGYGINNCFVSVLAAQQIVLSMQSPSSELRSMGLRIKEPSVVRYAFQQRFLEFANQHLTLQTPARVAINDMIEDWEIGIMSESSPLERLQQAEDALLGLFFWCVDSTAAYDAILIYAHGRIRFIQVTSGAEHSFKVYAVDSLLRTLQGRGIIFTHVDFVVVRPSNDNRAFTLKNPVGSLDNWVDFSGEQWARGGNARNQVRYARVPWE
jgi:hypothetical protein